MKKLIMFLMVFFAMVSIGYSDAGVARYQRTYKHGHNTDEDGGAIHLPMLQLHLNTNTAQGNGIREITSTYSQWTVDEIVSAFTITNKGTTISIQPTIPGRYLVTFQVCSSNPGGQTAIGGFIKKNLGSSCSADVTYGNNLYGTFTANSMNCAPVVTGFLYFNGTSDTVSFCGLFGVTNNTILGDVTNRYTIVQMMLLSK